MRSDVLTSPVRRLVGGVSIAIALGLAAALALPVSAAAADPVNLSACNNAALSRAFAPWADPSSYELAPGGDFESAAWTLEDGAQLTAGSEPYAATGSLGDSSLLLPAGSSAESPLTCVDAAYPTVRFFMTGGGVVAVSVVDDGLAIPAGIAVATGDWQPTPVMMTESPLLGVLSGGTAQMSLQLTALAGDPQIDDVFIDPWNRG
jgi:hypothetical protein